MSEENLFYISGFALYLFQHSHVCPVRDLSADEQAALYEKAKYKNVALAVAVLLESSDHYVLFTQRSYHLNSFPGLWVPPGGHVGKFFY